MDYRRRIKYKLARISEEDEDEEDKEATEGTLMMEEHDDSAFTDEDDQDPVPDPTEDGTTDTHPHSDSETDSDGTPVDEPQSVPADAVNIEDDEVGEANGDEADGDKADGDKADGDVADGDVTGEEEDGEANGGADGGAGADEDGGIHVYPPPSYQDPPPYTETMRLSLVKPNSETQRRVKQDSDENLEWDKDQSVETRIVVNPFYDPRDESLQEDIEMGDMTDAAEASSELAAPAETSYITPSLGSIRRFVEPMEIESQTANTSSWSDGFHMSFKQTSSRSLLIIIVSILIAIAAVLIVILLPLAFSYVEYYELGLKRQRSTGRVLSGDGVFESGRYAIGPDYTFKKYPSWATIVQMDDISVTTTSGLSHGFSCSFQYFIREGELGLLEQRFDQGYPDVIESVSRAAIKNVAASISLSMYLQDRRQVEIMFHEALRVKLGGNCCPDREQCLRDDTCHLCSNSTTICNQGYHVDVPFFQLLEIDLPSVIIDINLQVQLMNEQAEMETFVQLEVLTRKETERLTEDILFSASEITNNGTSYASLIQSRGEAEARAVTEAANSKGLALMYNRMGVVTDDHKASLHWLRTLEKQDMLIMGISFEDYLKLVTT